MSVVVTDRDISVSVRTIRLSDASTGPLRTSDGLSPRLGLSRRCKVINEGVVGC